MKYVPLFILIQLVSLVLTVLGLPVCAVLAGTRSWVQGDYGRSRNFHWTPRWTWIWDNLEDGVFGPYPHTAWYAFYWTALRNPCNNLRFCPGVSGVGRPLFLVTWKKWYFQAGWRQDTGWPVLSAGAV